MDELNVSKPIDRLSASERYCRWLLWFETFAQIKRSVLDRETEYVLAGLYDMANELWQAERAAMSPEDIAAGLELHAAMKGPHGYDYRSNINREVDQILNDYTEKTEHE